MTSQPEARGGFLDGGRFQGYAASREDHEKVAEAAGKGANSSLVAATESQNLDSKNEVNYIKIIKDHFSYSMFFSNLDHDIP